MAGKEVTQAADSPWAHVQQAKTEVERYEAGQYAVEAVPVPGFELPVPRLFFDLDWIDEQEDVFDAMLAQMAAASDIDQASQEREKLDPYTLVGKPVTVLGGRVQKSELDPEDAKWGAYLWLTVSVDGGAPQLLLTGAGEVCVLFWRKYCAGEMPFEGTFITRGKGKTGRKPPLGFAVQSKF